MTDPAVKVHAPPEAPEDYKPFVPASVTDMRELTIRGVAIGSLLGIVFAASSVYLGLKVGLTVSASIPVAVLSITLFRWLGKAPLVGGLFRGATILENNIVQTTGSAGESIAAGVAFTLPSLLLMGFDLELSRILLVALLGGLIGVLMMIPLRHGLIVKEHGKLTYPEGTACADVLIVGEQGGTNAKTVFLGFFVGGGYAVLNLIAKLWSDTSSFALHFWGKLKGATIGFEVSPPMLGVGYIIGPKVAANMMAGGLLAFVVLIPLVHLFGDSMMAPMYPATMLIKDMTPGQLRNAYVLYIGAGAVATGGFIALARAVPTIVGAFAGGLKSLRAGAASPAAAAVASGSGAHPYRTAAAADARPRTEQDLPMKLVLGGALALAAAIWLAPTLHINAVSAVLIVLFGFFFVTVSSRITGEIGSSSNPISGMTVATLLLTCGLFVLIGWTGVAFKAMALSTAALVCVAASNGGTISQDLKTGFLVGATPRHQQVSILVGVVSSAVVIGFVLLLLNQSHATFKAVDFPGYAAPPAAAGAEVERAKGPDGNLYRVHYVNEDVGDVVRGKYLVDDGGKALYLVDPGVCGTYPYKLEARTYPGVRLPIPLNAPTERGIDRKVYKVADLKDPVGAVPAGRYLVDDAGQVVYASSDMWKFDAPKAQLFRLIIDGTLGGKLPWGLVLVGVFLAVMMELLGVSSLPFAVGLYLPIYTSAGIFVGGCVRWLVDRKRKGMSAAEAEFSPGVLMASGLIAGGAIAGVVQAIIAYNEWDAKFDLSPTLGSLARNGSWWPMLPFLAMAGGLLWIGMKSESGGHGAGGAGKGHTSQG
jgi:putative OPT family oligopeptide transporter